MTNRFAAGIACLGLCGCWTLGADYFILTRDGVRLEEYARTPSRGGIRLRDVEINLSKVSQGFADDIWVEIEFGVKTKLSEVTPQLLKEHGFEVPAWSKVSYYRDGARFDFGGGGRLVCAGFAGGTDHRRVGSFSRGTSVAFPSSVPEVESVFGKLSVSHGIMY